MSYVDKEYSLWSVLILADETKMNLFRSDGRVTVWRKVNVELNLKNVNSTIKHGGGSVIL